jgi:hypothetical protein
LSGYDGPVDKLLDANQQPLFVMVTDNLGRTTDLLSVNETEIDVPYSGGNSGDGQIMFLTKNPLPHFIDLPNQNLDQSVGITKANGTKNSNSNAGCSRAKFENGFRAYGAFQNNNEDGTVYILKPPANGFLKDISPVIIEGEKEKGENFGVRLCAYDNQLFVTSYKSIYWFANIATMNGRYTASDATKITSIALQAFVAGADRLACHDGRLAFYNTKTYFVGEIRFK